MTREKKPIPAHLLRPIFSITDIATMLTAFFRVFQIAREQEIRLGVAGGLDAGKCRYMGDTDLAMRLDDGDIKVIIGTMNRMLGFTDTDLRAVSDGINSNDTWAFAKKLFAAPGSDCLEIGDLIPESILTSSRGSGTPDA